MRHALRGTQKFGVERCGNFALELFDQRLRVGGGAGDVKPLLRARHRDVEHTHFFAQQLVREPARDGAARKSEVVTLGGSYSSGPWSTSLGLARNKFESGFNPLIIASLLGNGGTNGTFALGNVEHRDMLSVGAGYQLTPQLNLGAHYWHVRQTGRNIAGDGKADFYAVVADYAFSKRTDVYLEIDRTRFRDSLTFANGATSRVGTMVGVRHRF